MFGYSFVYLFLVSNLTQKYGVTQHRYEAFFDFSWKVGKFIGKLIFGGNTHIQVKKDFNYYAVVYGFWLWIIMVFILIPMTIFMLE